jgi:septum formation protein
MENQAQRQKHLILASSSPFRRELLQRLRYPFECDSPHIDESAITDESPEDYVKRLSLAKAQAIAAKQSNAWVIGSDQCAVLNNQVIGKPKNHEEAVAQLQASSGKSVQFLTGLCVLDSDTKHYQVDLIPYTVVFRALSLADIEAYLALEQPYQCAGSFKSEALGVSLFQAMRGDDPTALIGLPLIRLCEILRQFGLDLPQASR